MTANVEDFHFNEWFISVSQSHILPSQCLSVDNCKTGNLCDFCLYSKDLNLPHFPEMVYSKNTLELRHSRGFAMKFNPLDALKLVIVGQMPLKVACADEWKLTRRSIGYVDNHIHPFDWTFSTEYSGTLEGDCRIEETDQSINIDKLKIREQILFYKELILFEDELHDNGIALYNIRLRVMPSGFFLLCRFFLRVDGVLIRVIDNRYHFEVENDFILHEVSFREGKFEEINHPMIATLVDPTEYIHLLSSKHRRNYKLFFKETSRKM